MSPEAFTGLELTSILTVFGVAASPIAELRGAIPLAILHYDFPWYYAYLVAVIGNLLPVPFILLFLKTVIRLLSKVGFLNRLINWFFASARRRGRIVERYERIGLVLFVAVPLPITGAWTGSLVAVLLGLKFRHAFLSVFAGILIAGTVVTCGTLLGWTIFDKWNA